MDTGYPLCWFGQISVSISALSTHGSRPGMVVIGEIHPKKLLTRGRVAFPACCLSIFRSGTFLKFCLSTRLESIPETLVKTSPRVSRRCPRQLWNFHSTRNPGSAWGNDRSRRWWQQRIHGSSRPAAPPWEKEPTKAIHLVFCFSFSFPSY